MSALSRRSDGLRDLMSQLSTGIEALAEASEPKGEQNSEENDRNQRAKCCRQVLHLCHVMQPSVSIPW